MRHTPRLTLTVSALLAVSAVAAGCSSAGATQARARFGTETFVLATTSAAVNPDYGLRASGLFAGAGTMPGIGSGENSSVARLPGGTFIVSHPASDEKVTSQSVNPHTCVAVLRQSGTYSIGHGTGTFAGMTGYGTDTGTITARLPRHAGGSCDTSTSARPVAGSVHAVITMTGRVLIPPRTAA